MKVLLFTQTGDERPKCAAWWEGAWAKALMAVVIGDPFSSVQFHSFNKARKTADRWWLVECENAEAGRAVISATVDVKGRPLDKSKMFLTCDESGNLYEGRILASGGKS